MAAETFGLSFAPLQQDTSQPTGPSGGYAGGGVSPVQQAIQILSLRQPRVFGAGAPAPPQLLTAAGGSGVPDLQVLLRSLLQHLQGQTGLPQTGSGPGMPPSMGGSPLAGIFGTPAGAPTIANPMAPTPRFDFPINPTDPDPPLYEPSPSLPDRATAGGTSAAQPPFAMRETPFRDPRTRGI